MSEKIQTISPTGKLNWDDSLELIPSGDCRERWHVEMSEVGKYGKLTNMRSDLNWDINLGEKEHVIGGCYDAKRDRYILVLSNENALTTARFVYVQASATTPFYTSDEIFEYENFFENFTSIALATGTLVSCKMIDDIIITVDGVNENKAFDVVKCKKVNDGTIKKTALAEITSLGSYPGIIICSVESVADFTVGDTVYIAIDDVNNNLLYGGITTVLSKLDDHENTLVCETVNTLSDDIVTVNGYIYKYVSNEDFYHAADDSVSMIIPTPRFAPEVKMVFDVENDNSAIDVNYGVYQFAYSYVYFDNSESLLSPFSVETVKKELPLIDNTGESFNTIKVTINIDRANIKKIRLYVRYIYKSVSNFYLIEEFARENIVGNILDYDFYGNISSIATNNVDAFTIQDAVPYSSETIEVIKENVVTIGGNTEGYDVINSGTEVDYFVDDTVDTMTLNSTLTNNAYAVSGQEVFGDKFNQIDNLTLIGITSTYSDHGYLYFRIYINGSVVRFVVMDRPLYSSFPGVYLAYAEWSTSNTTTTKTITELGSPLTGIGGSITITKPSRGWTYTFGYIKTDLANTDKTSITISNTGEDDYYKISLDGLLAQNLPINSFYIPTYNATAANIATRIAEEINALTYDDLATVSGDDIIVAIEPDATYASISIENYTKSNQQGFGGFIDDTTHLVIQNYYDKYGRLKYVSDVKKVTVPYLTSALSLDTYGISNTYISATIKDTFPTDCDTFSFSVARPNKRWEQYPVYPFNIWAASAPNTGLDYAADTTKTGLYAIAIDNYAISAGLGGYTFQAGDQIRIVAYYDPLTYESESATKYAPLIYRDIIKSSDILADGSTVIFVDAAKIKAFITASVDNEMSNVYDSSQTISTGTLTEGAVYKIIDTDPDYFGQDLVIGDIFKANGTEDCDSDNEVQLLCFYIFEVYRDYGNLEDTVVFTETSQRYLCSDYEVDEVIKIYDGTSFVNKNTDPIHTGLRFKTPIIYKDSTIDTRQYGKPLYRDDNSTIKYWNNVRNGGKAFQNTSINNLFRFDALDVVYLNDNYGTIKGMAVNGNTLRVYQERHNASIYIGGTEMANQDGEVQIIRSDKVLGSYRYSQDNTYGLQCKTGMVNTGNDVYIWDLINGVIVKDSNGMMPIVGRVSVGEYSNDFKMERFFKEKSKLVTSRADFKISLGYNRDNRVVFVSNSYDTSYPTICFSEEFGFWYQFLTIKPSFYLNGALGTIYSNAANDEIYNLFSDENGRCEITGVPSSFKFQVVANDNGKMKKVFEAISTQSSQAFDTVIEIEPTASYRYLISGEWKGMKSEMSKGFYRLEEGIYRGEILKNMYPDSTNYRLYNGEVMRGSAALITFTETDSDEPIEVLAVDVSYSDSST